MRRRDNTTFIELRKHTLIANAIYEMLKKKQVK